MDHLIKRAILCIPVQQFFFTGYMDFIAIYVYLLLVLV